MLCRSDDPGQFDQGSRVDSAEAAFFLSMRNDCKEHILDMFHGLRCIPRILTRTNDSPHVVALKIAQTNPVEIRPLRYGP